MKPFSEYALAVCLVLVVALAGCSQMPVSEPEQQQGASGQDGTIARQTMKTYHDVLGYMNNRKYNKAEPLLLEMTGKHPDLSGPFANLGIVYAETGRYDKAEQSLRKAISINPNDAEVYNRLAVLLRNQGRFSEAQSVYRQGLKVQPDNRHLLLNLGILYDLYLGSPDEALVQYEAYMKIASDDKRVNGWIVDLKRRLKEKVK